MVTDNLLRSCQYPSPALESRMRGAFPMRRLLTLIACLVALTMSSLNFDELELLYGPAFEAKVLSVADGDTLTVSHNRRKLKIRLYGVDAPEKLQEWGAEARLFTTNMIDEQTVRVTPVNRDRYGRTVAYVVLKGGTNLNYELVANGFAWWYRQYAKNDLQFQFREIKARLQRKGLWNDDEPVPPWQFRKGVSVNREEPVSAY